MLETQIQDSLMTFIAKDLLNDQPGLVLTPDADLLSSQLVDSLGVMRIVDFLEQRFEVKIPPTDVTIEHFIDIRTISAYLLRLRG